jgi:hypothetical protein
MIKNILFIFFILAAGNVFALGSQETAPVSERTSSRPNPAQSSRTDLARA